MPMTVPLHAIDNLAAAHCHGLLPAATIPLSLKVAHAGDQGSHLEPGLCIAGDHRKEQHDDVGRREGPAGREVEAHVAANLHHDAHQDGQNGT